MVLPRPGAPGRLDRRGRLRRSCGNMIMTCLDKINRAGELILDDSEPPGRSRRRSGSSELGPAVGVAATRSSRERPVGGATPNTRARRTAERGSVHGGVPEVDLDTRRAPSGRLRLAPIMHIMSTNRSAGPPPVYDDQFGRRALSPARPFRSHGYWTTVTDLPRTRRARPFPGPTPPADSRSRRRPRRAGTPGRRPASPPPT